MKPVITKEEVGGAISQLTAQGKKPTLVALHAALDHRGSMSTLVRLKAEVDAEAQRPTDSPDALDAFREVWDLARAEGLKEQEQALAELRESIKALASENERLEGAAGAAQKRAADLEAAKSDTDADLNRLRISAEHDLSQATTTISNAGSQAAKALQELAEARGAYATRFATLQAELTAAYQTAHEFELQLVRARTLLEAKGLASEEIPVCKS
jgi:chromosome segregation ATPase